MSYFVRFSWTFYGILVRAISGTVTVTTVVPSTPDSCRNAPAKHVAATAAFTNRLPH
ncbi:hypothetical protein EJ02DRAFT_458660 [Clathrospora elynae]|uniref:Uncharacterized protein n=1 Tax=Clathrospora elynae TaxID=706981 RepID=A0A6A5SCV9_9PLEO|nr:hypothetical protein EJ02DRAFT_458660 [Clathrospora elynae]